MSRRSSWFAMLAVLMTLLSAAAVYSQQEATKGAQSKEKSALEADKGSPSKDKAAPDSEKPRHVVKTDKEWAKILTRPQYLVTRQKETEPAFSGKYVNNHAAGIYACVCCGEDLFSSRTKFDSGTGWPSFYAPIKPSHIATQPDFTIPSEARVEVECASCGAHLGHVFSDGPPPTGQRFCINSLSLKFNKGTATAAKAKSKTKTAAKGKTAASPKTTANDPQDEAITKSGSKSDDGSESDTPTTESKKSPAPKGKTTKGQ
jgi:peptide-methionine (R)-S-oxide reductase